MHFVTAEPAACTNSRSSSSTTAYRRSFNAPTFNTMSTAVQPRRTASSVSNALTAAGTLPNGKAIPVPISTSGISANSSRTIGVQYALLV